MRQTKVEINVRGPQLGDDLVTTARFLSALRDGMLDADEQVRREHPDTVIAVVPLPLPVLDILAINLETAQHAWQAERSRARRGMLVMVGLLLLNFVFALVRAFVG